MTLCLLLEHPLEMAVTYTVFRIYIFLTGVSLRSRCSTWRVLGSGRVDSLAGSKGLSGSPGACHQLALDPWVPSCPRPRGSCLQSVEAHKG